MSETQVCEVCGLEGANPDDHTRDDLLRIALREKAGAAEARAALSAAEKERDEAVIHMKAAEALRDQLSPAFAAAEKREARLRMALRARGTHKRTCRCMASEVGRMGSYHGLFWSDRLPDARTCDCGFALELASVASEAQPPPASPMPVASSTQEGEK